MSEQSEKSSSGGELKGGARVRAIADGEAARPASLDQISKDQIAFERTLREAVGRVMGEEVKAPAALRQSVTAMFRETPAEAIQHDGVVRAPGADTRSRAFWARRHWMSLAAAVALMAAGSFFVVNQISMRRISALPVNIRHVATFVESEHSRCSLFGGHFDRKFAMRSEAEAAKAAMEILDRVPDVLEFPLDGLHQAGYEFAGIGPCKVPGAGKSAHLIYRAPQRECESISLFVQVDTNQLEVAESASVSDDGANANGHEVVIWRRDGMIYYLFAPDRVIEATALEDMHVPARADTSV